MTIVLELKYGSRIPITKTNPKNSQKEDAAPNPMLKIPNPIEHQAMVS
jgi:hypothetical protein